MDRKTLERLAANPHYKMTQRQLDQLAEYRNQPVQHARTVQKHQTDFEKHSPELRKEADEQSIPNAN